MSNFTYEQVMFMKAMKKRWHWHLIAGNLFPIAASQALETGLLAIIEEGYGVSAGTTDKLNKLVSQSNYIYMEYNIKVLYGLQSIKVGDTSQRAGYAAGTCKEKPVHFTEKRYSTHYRNFVSKLENYNQLEEVWKFYLEEVMKEYLKVHVDEIKDSDGNVDADNETYSDGD
ncbi:hypothetical protein FRC11_008911 [Ceratobasidium sp. 423]|nr:hypothetical protein FRC11_008911 [Ceratobasidium sp. 423]